MRRGLLTLALLAALVPTGGAAGAAPPAPAGGDTQGSGGAAIDPWLAGQLAQAAPVDLLTVMVHARDAAHLNDATGAILRGGLRPVTTWDRIGVAVGWGTPEQIRALARAPGVTYVEGSQPLEYALDTSHQATRADVALEEFQGPGGVRLDGTGVSIAVIDSGIDGTHPMFTGPDGQSKVARNLEQVCALNPTETPDDPYPDETFNAVCLQDEPSNNTDTNSGGGHGTHVAGIAAGYEVATSDGRALRGAAPGATLIGISTGATLAVVGANNGLNWVLEHHEQPCAGNLPTRPATCSAIRATNHSYGPVGGGDFDANSATVKLQRLLVAEGVAVVWAAGNDGGDGSASMTNPPGQDPTPGVLMVANYNDGDSGTRDGALDASSSRGDDGDLTTYPDLAAPGAFISSACLPTLPVCSTGLDNRDPFYNTISGTSMAAPHIAGYAATLFQAGTELTPGEVEDLLEDTAHEFIAGAPYEDDLPDRNADDQTSFDKGHGLVDMAVAFAELLGLPALPAPPACTGVGPQVTDPKGDATAVILDTLVVNQPALDVLEAYLTAAPASADPATFDVTFHIQVDDLPESPGGQSGEGEHFDFAFTYGGKGYNLVLSRSVTGGESFSLEDFGGTGGMRRSLVDGLVGDFDPAADLITVVLPAGAIAAGVEGAPVIVAGSVFAGLTITSRYVLVIFVPNADTASGACPFVVSAQGPAPELPSLRVGDVSVQEGHTGTTPMAFEVSLTQTSAADVTVAYTTVDGTATAGQDYTTTSGTLTIPAGATRAEVPVPVHGDTADEDDETFTLRLSAPQGADLLDADGLGTIRDDDGPPSISAADATAEEPDQGTGTMTFQVTLSHPATAPVTVRYATADGTATAGQDYTETQGTLTFTTGQQARQVEVTITGDTQPEPDETLRLLLSEPAGATIADGEAIGTILADDLPPEVSIGDAAVPEGDAGTTAMRFTLRLSEPAPTAGSAVTYATADAAATSPSDYQPSSGTVQFPAGATEAGVTVQVNGDTQGEPDEHLFVQLSQPVLLTLRDGTGIGVIRDDDRPVVDIADAQALEGDSGTTQMVFTVTLSNPSDLTVAVTYLSTALSATREEDYAPVSGQLQFAPGELSQQLVVEVVGDTAAEDDETFEVRLAEAANAVLGNATAVGTIVDDDGEDVIRLAGANRWETAIAVSQASFPAGSAEVVVLARGDDPAGYADALAGTPLAVGLDAPLLLTLPGELLPQVAAELQRVLAAGGEVVLLGGEAALNANVAEQVQGLGFAVRRIAGADRIATALAVAPEVTADPRAVLLARAFDFPDALSAGAAAVAAGGVVLLNPDAGADPSVQAYVDAHPAAVPYAVGGQMAAAFPGATPLAGADRIATALAVAAHFFPTPTVVGIARSDAFPDSLAGGAHIAAAGGPMLLTPSPALLGAGLDPRVTTYLCSHAASLTRAYLYGGTAALGGSAFDATAAAIRGDGCA